MTITWKSVYKKPKNQRQRNREVNLNHSTLNQVSPRRIWKFKNDTYRAYTAVLDIVQTRHWFGHCVVRDPSNSHSDLHEILSVHHVKRFRINVLVQSQVCQAEWIHPNDIDEGCHLNVAKMLFPMKDADLHRNLVWTELRDVCLEQGVCYFGIPKRIWVASEGSWMSEAAARSSARNVSCWNRFQGKLIGRLVSWRRLFEDSRPR